MEFFHGGHSHCFDVGVEDLSDEVLGFEGVADEDLVLEPINATFLQSLEVLGTPNGEFVCVSLHGGIGEGATA